MSSLRDQFGLFYFFCPFFFGIWVAGRNSSLSSFKISLFFSVHCSNNTGHRSTCRPRGSTWQRLINNLANWRSLLTDDGTLARLFTLNEPQRGKCVDASGGRHDQKRAGTCLLLRAIAKMIAGASLGFVLSLQSPDQIDFSV